MHYFVLFDGFCIFNDDNNSVKFIIIIEALNRMEAVSSILKPS